MLKLPLYYLLAKYREYRRYWPGVAKNYKKLITYSPNNIGWRITLVNALYKSKHYKNSLTEVNAALSIDPTNSTLMHSKLLTLTKLDSKEAVMYGYEIKNKTKSADFHKAYADALILEGQVMSARAQYKLALNSADCREDMLTSIYYKLGTISSKKNAKKYFQKALSYTKSEKIIQLGLGGLHQKYGNNDIALKELYEKVTKESDNYNLWFEIGNIHSRLKQMVEARTAYSEFMRLERKHGAASEGLNDKQVVFEAYRGRSYACSPRAIYEAMIKDDKYADFQFVWVLRGASLRKYWRLYLNPRTQIIRYKSKDYFKAYGHAKYWITNMRLNFIEKTSKQQHYLQCWHGTPFKKMGYSVDGEPGAVDGSGEDRWFDDDTKQTDYFLAQSHLAANYFDEAFALRQFGGDNILFESGYPRNDKLHDVTKSTKRSIRRNLQLPSNKKVLLYAPTWRDNEYDANRGYVHEISTNFDALREKLGKDWIILYRAHYLIARGFDFDKYDGFVRDVSENEDINDLYIASDALMTDYSSVFFDYINLNLPVLFYMYDLERYQEMRGFYFDPGDLPGGIVKTEEEIVKTLQNLTSYQEEHQSRYNEFKNSYASLDDGRATQRVIEKVFEGI